MNKSFLKSSLLALTLFSATTVWPALAQAPAVPLSEVVAELRAEFPRAEILRAQTVERNGRRIHVVKFLTPRGQVRFLRVDADSGKRLTHAHK